MKAAPTAASVHVQQGLQARSHSITVAEDVMVEFACRKVRSSSLVSVLSSTCSLPLPPVLALNHDALLRLLPSEVATLLATLVPAFSEIEWKAAALDMLVVCHTLAVKSETAPVLAVF